MIMYTDILIISVEIDILIERHVILYINTTLRLEVAARSFEYFVINRLLIGIFYQWL